MYTGTAAMIMTGRICKRKVVSSIFTCHNPYSDKFLFGSLLGTLFLELLHLLQTLLSFTVKKTP